MNQFNMGDGPSPRDHRHTVAWVKTEDGDDQTHNDHKESSNHARINEGEEASSWNCSGSIAWVKVEVGDEPSGENHVFERHHLKEVKSEVQPAMDHQDLIINQVKIEKEEGTSSSGTHAQSAHSEFEDEDMPRAREPLCSFQGRIIESSFAGINMANVKGARVRKGRRKKKPAFTERELETLTDAVVPVEPRLLGAEYHTTTSAERDKLWDTILVRVNAVARIHRDRDDVHKRWNDLRRRVKIIYAEAVQREYKTGRDGPSTIQWLPWEEKVLTTVDTTSIYGVESGFDTEQSSTRGVLRRRRTGRLRPVKGHGKVPEAPVTASNETAPSPAACSCSMSPEVLNNTLVSCRMDATHDLGPFAHISSLPSASHIPGNIPAYATRGTVSASMNAPVANHQVPSHPVTNSYNTNDVQDDEIGPMYPRLSQHLIDSCPSSWEESPVSSEHGSPVPADPMVEMVIGQRSLIQNSERQATAQETMQDTMKRQQILVSSMLKQQSTNHAEHMQTLGSITKAIQDLTAVVHSLVSAVNNLVGNKSVTHQAMPVSHWLSSTSSDMSSLPSRSPSPTGGPDLRRNRHGNTGIPLEARTPLKRRRLS